ncbi:MAG: flp pilus-assembly TadE/G-like family protein [Ancrocorticia sp.]
MSNSESPERGSGTVIVLGLLVAFAIVIMGIMAIGDVIATRDRTQHVADVSALAGAEELRRSGSAAACPKAQEVAVRNRGTVSGCEVAGEYVVVVIHDTATLTRYSIKSRALAGPADRPPR